ncbi:MAG: secondary thiamine-phosphate synthase enzyme YjbQ [Candidatus Orphnella occulta]|nr:secondary thiamine-phosphate synthase enzyme YjbQ [Candidatus Orphnella occulta]MDP8296677.1 secondary thiamine-phosphate synthase enzyme YjbQ [Candidatus Orphnella occulta]
MTVSTAYIELDTKGKTDIVDITSRVDSILKKENISCGTVTVFVIGSTGAVTTIEYEPALESDIKKFFEKIIPSSEHYAHDATWGDANGHSHLRASLLGPSLTVPFNDNEMCLGTWQQIIFIDFDNRPRKRKLLLQFIGK